MSDQKPQKQELKQFFAKRVGNQVRLLLDLWRIINDEGWSQSQFQNFQAANSKLTRYSRHFEENEHLSIATQIAALLDHSAENKRLPAGDELEQLSDAMQKLSHLAVRRSDLEQGLKPDISTQKPVYIALQDERISVKLLLQLEFFGFRSEICNSEDDFHKEMAKRHPSIIIMDVDFTGKMHFGLDLMYQMQQEQSHTMPVIFWSEESEDIFTRLKATRAGSIHFHTGKMDLGIIIEEIEAVANIAPPTPYRVLVVDDSKSQAYQLEMMLSQAGLITQVINDPMLVLDALEEFQPEIILMDMFMPGCSGMEMANVVRQQEKYLGIPIVFLSAEDNNDLRMRALRNGGDEFLVKPIDSLHLATVIKSKGERSRSVTNIMQRDSLTSLLNHTTILRQLDETVARAKETKTPICFAMLDIDHFKNVNDTHGHPVGDKVIKSLALLLKQRLRKTDLVGRYGGEEFAVVLTNIQLADAVKIFDEIRMRFSQFKHVGESAEFCSTFSAGVVQLTDTNASNLTVLADEALYQAKRAGRNRVCAAGLEENVSKQADSGN